MSNKISHIWEGVFNEFPESDSSHIWDSERWLTSIFKTLSIPDASEVETVSNLSLVHEYPLPPVVAMLTNYKNDLPVRILDFGGSCGNHFLTCMSSLPKAQLIEFHIVEGKAICEKGRDLYSNYANVFFHESLPNEIQNFDIIHIAATLHYIRDWRNLLKQLLQYTPEVLMLNALNAGDIRTFVSYQNYYGEKIPVWFWNIHEILDFMSSVGHKLIYKSQLEFSFLGEMQPLPMSNFPQEFRLNRKCNLMFVPEK